MEAQLNKFFDFMEHDKKLSSNTLQSYKRDLMQYKAFILSEGLTYNYVKEEDIKKYIEEQKQSGKKATSISRSIASIRAFYQHAVKDKKAKNDPTIKIKAPKIEKRIPNFLTSEEVVLLLEQPRNEDLKGIRDKAMLEFAYATGMKATEVIMLNLKDVDTKQGVVCCQKGNQTREIPLGRLAIEAIDIYIKNARNILIKDENEEALFVNVNGTRLTRQGFWKIIKYYKEQANISKDITPHILRHSFATHLLQNGADIKSIQTMLGHADVASTQVYMQFQTDEVKDIYNKAHPRA